MNIVLWADLQCPYCLVGEENLKHAIEDLGLQDEIALDIKSYEIHRPEDGEGDHSLLQIFEEKDGFTPEQAKKQAAAIDQMALEEAGLNIDFGGVRESTDLDAHRLYKMAADTDPAIARKVRDLIHEAYFVKHLVLNDRKTLLDIAKEAGMNPEDVTRMLDSKLYIREVRDDEMELEALGAESVPYFIVGTEVVPEHLPKDQMKKVILRNLEKQQQQ